MAKLQLDDLVPTPAAELPNGFRVRRLALKAELWGVGRGLSEDYQKYHYQSRPEMKQFVLHS